MPFAAINGVRLYYEVLGSGRQPVMFLHGGPGLTDHKGEKRAFASLAEEYTLVFLDQRGSGQSEGSERYSHGQFAADVEGLRQHLSLGKMALYGGSYGGHIALEYAIRYQENLSHLVLRGTHASSKYDVRANEIALERGIPGVSSNELAGWIETMTVGGFRDDEHYREIWLQLQPLYSAGPINEAEVRAQVAAMPIRSETHNRVFQQCSATYDIVDQIGVIETPTLITVGRHDWICPVEGSEEMHRLIRNSRLVVFENSGHSPHHEEQEAYHAVFREFVTDGQGR